MCLQISFEPIISSYIVHNSVICHELIELI